jgi:hypothetical protein
VSTAQEKHGRKKQQREKGHKVQRATTYPKNVPRRTAVDLQRLIQRLVERSTVIAELLPQLLLRLSLDEVGRRRAGSLPLLLRMRRGATRSWESSA